MQLRASNSAGDGTDGALRREGTVGCWSDAHSEREVATHHAIVYRLLAFWCYTYWVGHGKRYFVSSSLLQSFTYYRKGNKVKCYIPSSILRGTIGIEPGTATQQSKPQQEGGREYRRGAQEVHIMQHVDNTRQRIWRRQLKTTSASIRRCRALAFSAHYPPWDE